MQRSASRGAQQRAALLLGVALYLLPRTGLAQPVEFTARKAEVDIEARCAELEGDVVVRRGPLRLRAPRLRLEETPDGARVEGPGKLSGCSCEEPPLELGFDAAEISRDGDVDLRAPRLMSGDTTLLYLPRLMLRGPNSAGLLPPRASYSGRDGAYLGAGVELPLLRTAGKSRGAKLRLGGGAYSDFGRVIDGGRVEVDVSEPGGRSHVAWESLDGGMLDIDSYSSHVTRDVVVALRVDAARGQRALLAPLEFARVIAPRDRARVAVMSADASILSYGLIRGDSQRGATLTEDWGWGAASGFALRLLQSDSWRLEWDADVLGLNRDGQSSLGLLHQALALDVGSSLGVLSVSAGAELRWMLREGEASSGDVLLPATSEVGRPDVPRSDPSAQLSSSVGMPLTRQFGAWRHWVEPQLAASARVGDVRWVQAEAALEQRFGGPARGQVEAGLDLALGKLNGEFPAAADLDYFRADMLAGGRWLGLHATVAGIADLGEGESVLSHMERVRLGRTSALHLNIAFDQSLGRSWRLLRPGIDAFGAASIVQASSVPWASPYAGLGASLGSELWVPLGRRFATRVSSVFELDTLGSSMPTWLFGSWGGAYRHPCGCLAVHTLLSHRLGRHAAIDEPFRAFDVSVGVELFDAAPQRPVLP
ncbi:MAG: hypothetical protein H6718_33395 [Polyangiaceae bacterium]|nr:hypothetical protein [Polyangiaceae bacterium]